MELWLGQMELTVALYGYTVTFDSLLTPLGVTTPNSERSIVHAWGSHVRTAEKASDS